MIIPTGADKMDGSRVDPEQNLHAPERRMELRWVTRKENLACAVPD